MRTEYRSAMDKITADEQYKSKLLDTLAKEQQKIDARKHSVKNSKLPIIASLSSAAVLALLIYSSTVLILPIFRNSIYDKSNAFPSTDYQIHYGEKPSTPYSNDSDTAPGQYSDNQDDIQKSVTDQQSDDNNETGLSQSFQSESDDTQQSTNTDNTQTRNEDLDGYRIVSYSPFDSTMIGSSSEDIINYDCVLHFSFEGFEKYGIRLLKNDIVFEAALSRDYTLADLFCDYYSVIIGKNSTTTSVTNGMLDNFFYIYPNSKRQIHVYADGIEIVNLDNVRLSEFSGLSDVYFIVSVT